MKKKLSILMVCLAALPVMAGTIASYSNTSTLQAGDLFILERGPGIANFNIKASQLNQALSGFGVAASNLVDGPIPVGVLPAYVLTNNEAAPVTFAGPVTNLGNTYLQGTINGSGGGLTNLNLMGTNLLIDFLQNLSANTNLVPASGYQPTYTGPLFDDSGNDLSFINVSARSRIREDGTISLVELNLNNVPGTLLNFYIQIWRRNAIGLYDQIASQDIHSLLQTGDNIYTLPTPITGIKEGDFIGVRRVMSSGEVNFMMFNNDGQKAAFKIASASVSTTGMNWEGSGTLENWWVPVIVYMQAPKMGVIGDSLMTGYPFDYGWLQLATDAINNHTNIGTSAGFLLKNSLGTNWTMQDMGVPGDVMVGSIGISNRFANDAVALHPRVELIEGGINDIGSGTSATGILNSWTNCLNQCSNAAIIPIILKILPNSGDAGDPTKSATWNTVNTALAALGPLYGGITIDAAPYVGTSGGLQPNMVQQGIFNYDGTHYTLQGRVKYMKAVVDGLAMSDTVGKVYAASLNLGGSMEMDGNTGGKFIVVNRSSVSGQQGSDLTISAGAAASTGTNLNGGNLNLWSGPTTGSGVSAINAFAASGAIGNQDNLSTQLVFTATAAGFNVSPLTSLTNGVASYASNLLSVFSITVSGSPFLWTNLLAKNVTIGLSGGVVQGVGINGTQWSQGSTNGFTLVPLQPREWMSITNTTVPSASGKAL